ncbi:MAG: tetratricopeptide repeat protein [Maribacter sp.]
MKRIVFYLTLLVVFEAEAQLSVSVVADSLYAMGNYSKAINFYSKEGSANASLQIARSYNAIGNYEKAIVQYEAVVQENPNLQIASFELGKLLFKVKDFNEARKLFSKLVSNESGNPEYHYYLGEAFRELGQPVSSLVAFKNAVQIDSTHLRSLFQLGKYFTIKQERDNALRYVDTGLRFYENDVSLINLKALILYNDGQYEKAIPLFERVLELGERKEYVYEKLGYSYYKNWEFDKAKEAYQQVVAINDDNSDAYFSLAEVYRKNRELDSAAVYIKQGMAIKRPIFAKGYNALAGLAREKGDLKTALAFYEKAHGEEPQAPRHYYQICTLYDQLGEDAKKKLEYYEGFLQKYGSKQPYISDIVARRISELKEQIHFSKE